MDEASDNRTGIPRLHLVTPDRADAATLATTAALLEAGAPLVQVRRKQGTDRERLAVIEAALAARRSTDQRVLVDDRIDLALAAGADGVHVGDDDLPVAAARRLAGATLLVGATARAPRAGVAAAAAGADYLGVGPLRASSTKPTGLPAPIGLDGVAAVADAVSIPVLAIAGVEVADVAPLVAAGAHGIAVSAAVYAAPDPVAAMLSLLDALAHAPVPAGRMP